MEQLVLGTLKARSFEIVIEPEKAWGRRVVVMLILLCNRHSVGIQSLVRAMRRWESCHVGTWVIVCFMYCCVCCGSYR